jgi:hypothetical protein
MDRKSAVRIIYPQIVAELCSYYVLIRGCDGQARENKKTAPGFAGRGFLKWCPGDGPVGGSC